MSDLGAAVKALVLLATKGGKEWAKREAAQAVITAFDPKDEKATAAALKALGAGLKQAKGTDEQLLLLVVGALVESGASPELAWPTFGPELKDTFVLAARFGDICVDDADNPGIPEAVKSSGPFLQKKYPKEAEAWEMLRPRCLTGVACLARSSELREKARAKRDLLAAADLLDGLVEPVTFFNHVLKLIDDVPLLVLHPETKRGWRFVMNDVTTNLEMFVLLLDALIGDPDKGMLRGTRPNARAVRILKDPDFEPKTNPEIKVFWNLIGWTGVLPDKTLPDPTGHDAYPDWVWLEGVPLDIPVFEGERVVMFQPPAMKRDYEVEGPFHALSPRLEMKGRVSAAEVDRLLGKMALAAKPIREKRLRAEAAAAAAARKAIEEAEREYRKKRRKR